MRLRTLTVSTAALALALAGPAAPALAHEADAHKTVALATGPAALSGSGKNMSPVATLPYKTMTPNAAANGSDIEFAKIGGREYAFAGTLRQGLQIIDITDPTTPSLTGHYGCAINQGDVQVFQQGARVLATYTADSRIDSSPANTVWQSSQCVQEANELGFNVKGTDLGTFLVDVTNPAQPKTVSFLREMAGSHNMTVHPSGNFLYNSNSDLLTARTTPFVTIFDISKPDVPVEVRKFPLPFVPTSLGTEAHDVTFNENGSRAYFAALSQTLVVDTRDPANPEIISQIVDPTIQVVHQSDPVTLTDRFGRDRTFLVITDERAGAAASAECPGGGLHVYDITDERKPRKMGAWFIPAVEPRSGSVCTSHVLRIHEEQQLMTIAWYTAGMRVIDLSGLADFQGNDSTVALGDGVGMREVGNYAFTDTNVWSFKTNKIAADGSFYGYGNDRTRGLDVVKFEGLDRAVTPLTPTDLAPGAKVKKPKKKGVVPFLPVDGGAGLALLGLAGAGALVGNVALVRRRSAATA
ncbi:MAG TPA: hypothetical protein VM433_11050 [Mycobacteriales bacterium]|nr:hypothetical protein [Mycobacteriales bacterium]